MLPVYDSIAENLYATLVVRETRVLTSYCRDCRHHIAAFSHLDSKLPTPLGKLQR